jgi:DNA repair/transcription protein MET18/MMS19
MPIINFLQLLPLLLRGLELSDDDLRGNIIDTFLSLKESESATTIISQHTSTLVNIMLKNASFQQQPSPVG